MLWMKYVVESWLPGNEETVNMVFQFLTAGLSGYLKPENIKKRSSELSSSS